MHRLDCRSPWLDFGNPCRGRDPETDSGPETTFDCQGACPFSVNGKQYVMLDRWNMNDFIDSRYFWLPIEFTGDGYEIRYQEEFEL